MANRVDNTDDFVALFAHDLRGTLGSVRSFADMLERSGELNEMQKRWLERVYANVERGLTMLDNMILLHQLESQPLQMESVELRSMIYDALEYVEYLLFEQNVAITVDIGIDADRAVCDPRWFQHVLYNLLSNAVKHNEPEGRVSVETWRGTDSIFLRVMDTGKGIPPADLEHIFDKFYRVRGNKSEGSGLGLAIVREIVERHGGRVSVESRVGEGTSFTVQLPISALYTQHQSGEALDALDDDAQEGADFTDYDDPSIQ